MAIVSHASRPRTLCYSIDSDSWSQEENGCELHDGMLNRPGFHGGCLVKRKPVFRSSRRAADSSLPQHRPVEYTQSALRYAFTAAQAAQKYTSPTSHAAKAFTAAQAAQKYSAADSAAYSAFTAAQASDFV